MFTRIGSSVSEAQRSIPIRDEVDVLVIGGGSAGVTAAIAAARQGARTLVVERYGFVGGLVTGGPTGLHTFFNCYHDENGRPDAPPRAKSSSSKACRKRSWTG